jgi:tripartite ATP-independent transporter DctM subunit
MNQAEVSRADEARGADAALLGAAWRTRLARIDVLLGHITEVPAAVLIIVETVVLLAGVISRYLFHRPLVWSDELAAVMFLWLAMLGSVIALRRSGHMRLTVLVNLAGPALRGWLQTVSAMIVALFVQLILHPAFEYTLDEVPITLPALDISGAWRSAPIVLGILLMLVISLMQMCERATPRSLIGAAAFVGAVAVLLIVARPLLFGLGNYNLLIFFVVMVSVCIAMGVPIAFAFGIATYGYLGLSTHVPLTVVVSRAQEGMAHLILLSVPLFIMLGYLIEMTGMARAMVNFLAALLGHVRAGLSYVLLGAVNLVSGISGAKAADMAAVAPVLFPEMQRRGEKPGELVALLSTSAAMSETIPPSLVLITIGSVTDVSIAALFTGGLLPALILAVALGVVARIRARNQDMAGFERPRAAQIARTLIVALPALLLPFVIRAAVVEGVATATEVSTIGIVYAMICGLFVYRQFDWRRLYPILIDTATLTGAILLIIGTATAMAWALTQSGFSRDLTAAMAHMPGGKVGFLAISIVAFIILGAVLEGIPALVLFAPLLFPIARIVGIHEVHYAMVVILAMGIGLFAPPIGVGYYAACAIGRVDPDEGMRPFLPYLAALFVGLLIVAAFPWLSIGFL